MAFQNIIQYKPKTTPTPVYKPPTDLGSSPLTFSGEGGMQQNPFGLTPPPSQPQVTPFTPPSSTYKASPLQLSLGSNQTLTPPPQVPQEPISTPSASPTPKATPFSYQPAEQPKDFSLLTQQPQQQPQQTPFTSSSAQEKSGGFDRLAEKILVQEHQQGINPIDNPDTTSIALKPSFSDPRLQPAGEPGGREPAGAPTSSGQYLARDLTVAKKYPDGYKFTGPGLEGECAWFAQIITNLPKVGSPIGEKKATLAREAKAGKAFYKGEASPQVGYTVFTTESSKWGHIAVVNGISADGKYIILTEANYDPNVVHHTRKLPIDSPKIIGYFKTQFKPQFKGQGSTQVNTSTSKPQGDAMATTPQTTYTPPNYNALADKAQSGEVFQVAADLIRSRPERRQQALAQYREQYDNFQPEIEAVNKASANYQTSRVDAFADFLSLPMSARVKMAQGQQARAGSAYENALGVLSEKRKKPEEFMKQDTEDENALFQLLGLASDKQAKELEQQYRSEQSAEDKRRWEAQFGLQQEQFAEDKKRAAAEAEALRVKTEQEANEKPDDAEVIDEIFKSYGDPSKIVSGQQLEAYLFQLLNAYRVQHISQLPKSVQRAYAKVQNDWVDSVS